MRPPSNLGFATKSRRATLAPRASILAAALRVPVVALFGPTRPERNGPFATRSVVLRSPDSVDDSSHINRPDEGLTSIAPQSVIAAADQLLGGHGA